MINPDLQQPLYHTTTAAIEHELMPNFSLRGLYVYNRQATLYSATNPLRPYEAYTVPVPRLDPVTGTPIVLYTYPASVAGAAFVQNFQMNRDGRPDSHIRSSSRRPSASRDAGWRSRRSR